MARASKTPKKLYVIKRELTLDGIATTEFNSYWCGVYDGWGLLSNALALSKTYAQRVLSKHHSGVWYTKREHAHLFEVDQESSITSFMGKAMAIHG
jgi:hypothetical protein